MATYYATLFVIGSVFAPIAALMAFLIPDREYSRHGLGRAKVWRESLTTALLALLLFIAAPLLIGWIVQANPP